MLLCVVIINKNYLTYQVNTRTPELVPSLSSRAVVHLQATACCSLRFSRIGSDCPYRSAFRSGETALQDAPLHGAIDLTASAFAHLTPSLRRSATMHPTALRSA